MLSIAIVTKAGVSFRAVSKIFIFANLYFDLNLKIPTHTTVLNWTKKQGIGQFRDKEFYQKERWVLIIDESIRFGNKKLLLVLAVSENRCIQGKALSYKDVIPLVLKVSPSWKSTDIIPEINEKIDLKQVAYFVSDGGSNFLAMYKSLAECTHIYDITHKISLIMQSVFETNLLFNEYTKALSSLRTKKSMSKIARIVPDNQRVMSRFMNLMPSFDWGVKMIKLLEQNQLSEEEETALSFLNCEMKNFVSDTHQILTTLNKIQKLLKTKGFNEVSKKEAQLILSKLKSTHSLKIRSLLEEYFADLTSKAEKKTICCSSDIIESCLGKYKEIAKGNKSVGISDLCLCIASVTGEMSNHKKTKEIFETVTMKDVKEWKEKNVSKTLFAEKKELNKKVVRK